MVVTVAERKAREIERLRSASVLAFAELGAFAGARGGRYVIFGSFARGDFRRGSDVDIMVEFPAAAERHARDVAEATLRKHGLVPDVHLASEVSDALMTRVRRDAVVLQ